MCCARARPRTRGFNRSLIGVFGRGELDGRGGGGLSLYMNVSKNLVPCCNISFVCEHSTHRLQNNGAKIGGFCEENIATAPWQAGSRRGLFFLWVQRSAGCPSYRRPPSITYHCYRAETTAAGGGLARSLACLHSPLLRRARL